MAREMNGFTKGQRVTCFGPARKTTKKGQGPKFGERGSVQGFYDDGVIVKFDKSGRLEVGYEFLKAV